MGKAKETLELEIKMLIAEAQKNVQAIQGDIKRLAKEAQVAAPDTKALADAMKKINGDEMKRAAAEANLFGSSLGSVKKQQNMVKEAMIDLVNAGLAPESAEIQKLLGQYNDLTAQSSKLEKQTGQTSGSVSELTNTLGQLATVKALTTVVGAVVEMGSAALDTAKEWQKTEQTFGTLLQNVDAGRALFKEIQEFNVWTPFDLPNIETATKGLLGAKVPVDQLTTKMTMFGDLSLGNAVKFNSFTNEFVKASVKGKLSMENLNVYLEQGIPILDTLASQFNTTSTSVSDMVSKGEVSVADFEKALVTLTSKGGIYYEGMVTGSQSLDAVQIGLKESQAQLVASFVSGLIPALTTVTQWMTDLTNTINDSPIAKGILAGAVVAVTGYMAAMAVKQALLAVKTWLAYAAQMGFASSLAITNPLLIAGVIAAGVATAAIVVYAATQSKAAQETDKAALTTVTHTQNQKLMEEQTKKTTEAVAEQKEAMYDWKKSMENFMSPVKNSDELKEKIEYLKKAYNGITNESGSTIFRGIPENVSAAFGKLQELFSGYQLDPFGAAYDAFKKAKTDFDDFIKDSTPKLSKLQLLDVAKTKFDLAALAVFSGAEQQKKQEEINTWYQKSRIEIEKEIAEKERETLMNAHQLRMENSKKEWEYQRELARTKIESGKATGTDIANYAKGDAKAQIANTDVGQLISGGLKSLLTMFISALVKATIELENVNKLLNFMGTVVNAAFAIFGPIINQTAGEFVAVLVEVGTIIGQFIAPFLSSAAVLLRLFAACLKIVLAPVKLLGDGFEWLYNNVLVPGGNKIIDMVNGLIDLLNKVPFVDIDKISNLQVIGKMAEEMAKEVAKQQVAINKLYDRQIDRVNDLLSSQIDSIKTQYELGLISRADYESQAEAYQSSADAKSSKLDDERNLLLKTIELNTRNALSAPQLQSRNKALALDLEGSDYLKNAGAGALIGSLFGPAGTLVGAGVGALGTFLDDISGGLITDIGQGIGAGIANIGDGISHIADKIGNGLKHLFGFAVGSTNIPIDMPARVHAGEIIVPKTFADGVRAGDLSISGTNPKNLASNSSGHSYTSININLTVQGSVVTEKELTERMYDGLSNLITSGGKAPLPSAA